MSTGARALDAKREALERIPHDAARPPKISLDTYLQDARYLHGWCLEDRAALVRVGLDWGLVEDLPARIDATTEAQTVWRNALVAKGTARERWEVESRAGYDLRDELIHTMRFAYRREEDRQRFLDHVSKGTSHANMIQDLCDLSVAARHNPDPLIAVGMDPAKIDEAARMSDELGSLLAEMYTEERRGTLDLRLQRNRAYTHLKEAVDEIRTCGRFAFRKNETRRRGYMGEQKKKITKPEQSE